MAQLNFHINIPVLHRESSSAMSNGTLRFIPICPSDSISIGTLNIMNARAAGTKTLSIGLYSLTGSTLSIANSWSATISGSLVQNYVSLTATSATQNITPGNWWLGMLISTSGTSNFSLVGQTIINPANAFPGGFVQGIMTDSTNALPSSYATSNLDITGNDAFMVPYIILTA